MHGGCGESRCIPGQVPNAKAAMGSTGSSSKHTALPGPHAETATSVHGPNHRCQPRNAGTYRQQEMPGASQARGVPMAQACLHWGGKGTLQGLQFITALLLPSDVFLDSFPLKGCRWVPAEGRGLLLLCVLQLQGKGLRNRARAWEQTLLKHRGLEKEATLSQPGTEELYTEAWL